jgi:hypothetical protein
MTAATPFRSMSMSVFSIVQLAEFAAFANGFAPNA